MQSNMSKRIVSGLLAMTLMVSNIQVSVFATGTAADPMLCEHHASHTPECGYREAVVGKDCNHQHTQDCYVKEKCIHTHEENCGVDGVSCTHECTVENACLTMQQKCIHVEHDANCGMFDEENPVCNHGCQVIVDSEESCYALLCSHAEPDMHDDLCGYAEAISASDCEFVCEKCAKAKADALAVANVKALVDVLPTVDEVKDMGREEQLNAYNQTQEAYDAFNKLLDAQKAELPDAEVVFEGLFEYFNGLVNEINESTGGTCGEDLIWEYDAATSTLIISGSGAMEDFTVATAGKTLPNYPWKEYIGQIKKVELPNGLTKIGDYAFYHLGCLEEIMLPDALEAIGEHAFYSCLLLDEIVIPNSITSIGVNAFAGCSAISSIIVPDRITSLEYGTFSYCTSLQEVSLPDSLVEIGDNVFEYCALEAITIPDTVTHLGQWTFLENKSLTEITIPASVKSLGMQVFQNCSNLEIITFMGDAPVFEDMDGFAIPEQFDNITATVYYPADNDTWTDEVMKDYGGTITWIPCGGEVEHSHSFGDWYETKAPTQDAEGEERRDCSGCDHYETRITDKLPSTEGNSGTCGENLTWTLVDGVLTISGEGTMTEYDSSSEYAPWFEWREEISSVVISNGVTSVGFNAFLECSNLTSISIPQSVASISYKAISNCPALQQISVDENNTAYASQNGILFSKDMTTLVRYPEAGNGEISYAIPETVTALGRLAFDGCDHLTSITIPTSITEISYGAFSRCSALTSITIPESVTAIGGLAFQYTGLTSITIPSSVTSIGSGAFNNCDSLTEITFKGSYPLKGVAYLCMEVTANVYYPADDASWTEDVRKDYGGTLTWIPYGDTEDDTHTHSFGQWYEVKVPTNTEKGQQRRDCRKCDSYETQETYLGGTFGIGNSLTWMLYNGTLRISGSGKMQHFVSNVPRPWNDFVNSITSIILEDGVGNIGDNAFSHCIGLTSITIPDSVTSIGHYAFGDCSSLASIIIPDSVTSIGGCAFMDCSSLASVTIPNGVTSIGSETFSNCSSLTNVTIPDSVHWLQCLRELQQSYEHSDPGQCYQHWYQCFRGLQ